MYVLEKSSRYLTSCSTREVNTISVSLPDKEKITEVQSVQQVEKCFSHLRLSVTQDVTAKARKGAPAGRLDLAGSDHPHSASMKW